ncbi:phosphoglucomutase/phosphomannomutase family protein [Natronobacterium gregoryi]|uniref:Phosphoglucomutase n=2 Tax=Natronobacterium gregoryi TaxID=44930 RepID=L0AH62_NATGS|nr:phosphoglucomutase/phosphomannomutase family protein [Natronobacterium gregoryi]AFZ72769.1 phosphomannomutase [Natronobacterium gregoryi SP2]ELY69466.1 phosphoglucomutase/phosphomannomutase alpha/beta/alpha domain I [Natronobacterium gregoryi SP2]PLK21112.1 phosphoglucomutase [Natronobacterium gregoryi SP2]SFJ11300.1 Phosphomannomutase [Natronobacterium gregoryi]
METISFGTDGWRATLEEFTTPRVRMVGQAVATYLADEGLEEDVVIGYDARETSRGFAEELARVLCANGFDVLVPDRDRPTPLIAHAIVERDLAGGLAITASHNPPEYNGVKFIPGDGAPALPEVTDAIADRLAEPDPLPEDEHGTVREVDLATPHADAVLERVASVTGSDEIADDELTVAYDAMHGSGRGTTDAVLERAGLAVERLRCDRDPEFGGGAPEPAPANLEELIDRVTDGDADLGIANDGDADRIAVVTPERGYLDENRFFAALYDYLLEDADGPAIRTVSTTYLIDRIAEAHGESVREVPVGFKWVAEAMADGDALVGGEESGGFTIRGHVREKDGVLMALLAAAMHAEEPLDERVDRLLEDHGTVVQDKVSVACPDHEKARVIDDLDDGIPDAVAGTEVETVNTDDGFKLLLSDGSWLLVRPSGTEPVLRVYAEATDEKRVEELLEAGEQLVEPLV